jgi:hypothetical protein
MLTIKLPSMSQGETQKRLKFHIGYMLENILTKAELGVLARNKGITTGGISKEGLADLIDDKFLDLGQNPDQISRIYENLDTDYQFLLHYLRANNQPMKLEKAIRYLIDWKSAQAKGSYYRSVKTSEYRDFFSQFKTNLAVAGLIVIIEAPESYHSVYSNSKFERFSLYLPEEFHPLLPPLAVKGEKRIEKSAEESTKKSAEGKTGKSTGKGAGNPFEAFAKDVLLCSLGPRNMQGLCNPNEPAEKTADEKIAPKKIVIEKIIKYISWQQGFLHFQGSPVSDAGEFLQRIYCVWRESKIYCNYPEDVDLVTNLLYLLWGLSQEEWLELSQIQEIFGRLTRVVKLKEVQDMLPALCEEAVSIGLLEKLADSPATSYRLQPGSLALISGNYPATGADNGSCLVGRVTRPDKNSCPAATTMPDEGMKGEKNGSVLVHLNLVSLSSLLELLLISDWTPAADALFCYPSPIKCGKVLREFSRFSKLGIYECLNRISLSYRQTFQIIERDFGKFMIHLDLSIFEIADITISALLQHAFPCRFYPVGGNFFAASKSDENEILRFLEQKKYSVRIKG